MSVAALAVLLAFSAPKVKAPAPPMTPWIALLRCASETLPYSFASQGLNKLVSGLLVLPHREGIFVYTPLHAAFYSIKPEHCDERSCSVLVPFKTKRGTFEYLGLEAAGGELLSMWTKIASPKPDPKRLAIPEAIWDSTSPQIHQRAEIALAAATHANLTGRTYALPGDEILSLTPKHVARLDRCDVAARATGYADLAAAAVARRESARAFVERRKAQAARMVVTAQLDRDSLAHDDLLSARIAIRNDSGAPFEYWTYDCAWAAVWTFSTTAVGHARTKPCPRNTRLRATIAPGATLRTTLRLAFSDETPANGRLGFRIGFGSNPEIMTRSLGVTLKTVEIP